MMKKRISLILCAAALLLTAASCADASGSNTTVTDAATNTPAGGTEAVTEPAETVLPYNYELADFGGYEFVFLNEAEIENNWANPLIAPEAANGETINDALYNRKIAVEDALNITIREEGIGGDRLASTTKKTVTAGDATYDAVMNRNNDIGSLITGGYLADLRSMEQLHFNEPWWDTIVCDTATINEKLYFASSDISLFPFEATWVLYFNETLLNRYDIEYPYDLVRDGKWTLDEFYKIVKAGTNVNSTEYNPGGSDIYGIVTHNQFMGALMAGAGEKFLAVDDAGYPRSLEITDRFYDVAQKIANITADKNQYVDRIVQTLKTPSTDSTTEFMMGTFLFNAETLGHIYKLRSFEDNFGVLPMPKYDEAQESYISMMATWGVLLTTVPKTNTDPVRTGTILDYLAYQSYISLMEPYYDAFLTQKGARNEDSADMLSIIRDTRDVNLGYLFSWSNSMEEPIREKLMRGSTEIASIVAKHQSKVQTAIDKTMDKIEENE